MRFLLSAALAASLLGSQAAMAAASCAGEAERTAFDIAGLKSQLMVTALTCSENDRYNAFVSRFRPNLTGNEKVLNSYFSRTFGRSGQKQHDDYITQLANEQSQTGLKQGTAFCTQSVELFDEVAALRNGTELPDFASGKTLVQPISMTNCGVEPRSAAPATTRSRRPSTSRHR